MRKVVENPEVVSWSWDERNLQETGRISKEKEVGSIIRGRQSKEYTHKWKFRDISEMMPSKRGGRYHPALFQQLLGQETGELLLNIL